MAALSTDKATKISTEAAENFVNAYYHALNSSRSDIASFYMPVATTPEGKVLPVIVLNGNILPDSSSMQALFQDQVAEARYEVQDYDCQILNPHYVAEGTQSNTETSGKNMTILITISGYVKYGALRSATMRGFSESIVLIPNPAAVTKRRPRNIKDWLIQSQNFRLVV